MAPIQRPGQQTLVRYFQGQCTLEEEEAIRLYLALNIDEEYVEACLREAVYLQDEHRETPADRNRKRLAWQKLIARLKEKTPDTFMHIRKWRSYAAVIIFLLIGAGYWLHFSHRPAPLSGQSVAAPAFTWITKKNEGAVTIQFLLPDTSSVLLSSGATITYASDFGQGKRDIYLEGTGRFLVKRDESAPFTVYAKGYATTALGTEFIVHSKEKNRVKVKLLSGRIVVKAMEGKASLEPTFLHPGQELVIDVLSGMGQLNGATTKPAPSVRQNRVSLPKPSALFLHFQKTPLPTVLAQVKNALHVEIDYSPAAIEGVLFSGRLMLPADDETQTIEAVFQTLCKEEGLIYHIEGKRITLHRAAANGDENTK